MRSRIPVMALAALALAGCGDASAGVTATGTVTEVGNGYLCVGPRDGGGDCYVAEGDLAEGIGVGDCVEVSAAETVGRVVLRVLRSVTRLPEQQCGG